MNYRGHFINGAWKVVPGNAYASVNPATGERVLEVSYGDGSEVEEAVEAAHQAFLQWRMLDKKERASYLERFAEALKERSEPLAQAITAEMGKTILEARAEAAACVAKIGITLGEGQALVDRFDPEGLDGSCHFMPFGVMAVIGPYNFPAHLANGHIVPALMTGNTVVFKPSSVTPLVGQVYAEAAEAAGFPPGVFNLLHIRRAVGDKLLTHPLVRGVLFTGSYEVGLHIKRVTLEDPWKILALEMGGKNCSIVCQDAHLEQALTELVTGAYLTTGQRCTGTARVIVHDSLVSKLEEGLARAAGQLKSGDPLAADTFMGPLASASALQGFMASQEMANKDPALATLVAAENPAHCLTSAALHRVERYRPDHPYLREEVFGPALTIEAVADTDEAIARALDTDYGLSFSIFTRERSTYETALRSVPCGIVNWNRATNGASGRLPFGGLGKSGNHRPAALWAPYYCTYPVAELRKPYGQVDENPCPGFPKEVIHR
ncbi:MAG: aldehyde dehydrogenase family protein [Candidatus Eremiobacteraeota bacterium]|nr:aldehyde dehydrogenase family protein [Candidatus Eremiobacteraeota bacterium]